MQELLRLVEEFVIGGDKYVFESASEHLEGSHVVLCLQLSPGVSGYDQAVRMENIEELFVLSSDAQEVRHQAVPVIQSLDNCPRQLFGCAIYILSGTCYRVIQFPVF